MESDIKDNDQVGQALEQTQHCFIDFIIEALVFVLFAFMPVALGVVSDTSEFWLLTIVAIISVCMFVRLIFRPLAFVWSWSYLPLAGFVLLVYFQTVLLPAGIVKAISPNTWQLKTEILTAIKAPVDYMTLSFNPSVTSQNLRILVAMAVVYVVILNIYRRPRQLRRLFKGIVLIGGVYAGLAFFQDVAGNGKIFWFIPTYDNANSGPFINHSHYSQYMNLILGFAIGMLMLRIHERIDRGSEVTFFEVMPRLYRPGLRVVWLCVAVLILGISTIFLSLSRAGMLALLVSGILTILIMALRRGLYSRNWVIILVSLLSFVCVLYIGFDAVYDRLATLSELEKYAGRWQVVGPIMSAFSRFWLFGTGQGSFDVVYPMFDNSSQPILQGHADIEYAQIMQETGILGFLLIGFFLFFAFLGCQRAMVYAGRSRCGVPVLIGAFGLNYGLMTVIIQSISDFGQRLPAVGMLTLLTCAVLASFTHIIKLWRNNRYENSGRPTVLTRPIAVLGLLAVLALWSNQLPAAATAMEAQKHWDKVMQLEGHLDNIKWQATNQQFTGLIDQARQASNLQPDNVRYRYWLNSYRWLAISRVVDKQGNIVLTDEGIGHAISIVEDLLLNCRNAPTFGANFTLLGQLQYFVLQDTASGADNIRRGYELAPCDPTSCYVAGVIAIRQGALDDAMNKFSHTLQLDGSQVNDIINECMTAEQPELAFKLVNHNPDWLNGFAYRLSQYKKQDEQASRVSQQVIDLLEVRVSETACPPQVLANLGYMYYRQGMVSQAAEMFKKAVAREHIQVGWHYQYAMSLYKLGDKEQALKQAGVCLSLKSTYEPALNLIKEINAGLSTGNKEKGK